MKVLDLFCGGGGASMGIHMAGHTVEGVDIIPQPDYPFIFHLDNAINYNLDGYDAYHASPPCQAFSFATSQWKNKGNIYVDLISLIRDRLLETGKPFVIENVVGAPLRKDLLLCGDMFDDGYKYAVFRHRVFEIHGFNVPRVEHQTHSGFIGDGKFVGVFGHGGGKRYNYSDCSMNVWKQAMHIDWINKRKTLVEAIPPDYTKYIFSYLKE